jgi:hypothetical protein
MAEGICSVCGVPEVYCKKKCKICYWKDYHQTPEYKERHNRQQRGYYKRPDVKERCKTYYNEHRHIAEYQEVRRRAVERYRQSPKYAKNYIEYNDRPDVKAKRKERSQRPEIAETIRQNKRNYKHEHYANDPEYRQKMFVRQVDALKSMIGIGIPKERCESCGTTRDLHNHHLTYYLDRPNEIRILCRQCHNAEHKRLRTLERQLEPAPAQ